MVKYKSFLNNGEDIMLLGLDLVILEIFVIDLFVKNDYFLVIYKIYLMNF